MPKPSLHYDLIDLRGLTRGELSDFEARLVEDLIALHNETAKLRNQISDLHWRANPEAMGR